MHPTEELELLAKWAWAIFGSSKGISGGRASPSYFPNGRPDVVDEHHEELAVALHAYSTLLRLHNSGERGVQLANLLVCVFVQNGELARRQQKQAKPSSFLQREQFKRKQEKLLQEALDVYLAFGSPSRNL